MMRRFLAWLRDNRAYLLAQPSALLVVVVTGLAGVGAGIPTGDHLYTYMWRDPMFCGDCHVHDYANEAWEQSVHAQLTTCHDCHQVPIRHYPRNLFVTVFDRPETPEDIPAAHVGTVLCEQCHSQAGAAAPLTGPMPDDLRGMVAKIDGSPLHRIHMDAKDRVPSQYKGGHGKAKEAEPSDAKRPDHDTPSGVVCLDCHGGADLDVHTFAADPRDCETCHEGITPADERGDALSCLDCHGPGFVSTGTTDHVVNSPP